MDKYQSQSLTNIEIATILEDFNYRTEKAKVYIPHICPGKPTGKPKDTKKPKSDTGGIVNQKDKAKFGIKAFTTTNYIELWISCWAFGEEMYKDGDPEYLVRKGKKILVSFIEGNYQDIILIGVYKP